MQRVQNECEGDERVGKTERGFTRKEKSRRAKKPTVIKPKADKYEMFGADNQKTLAELFVDFFVTLKAVEPMWEKGLVASTYAGRWTCGCSWPLRKYRIGVEDPFASGDNVARAVQRHSAPAVSAPFAAP